MPNGGVLFGESLGCTRQADEPVLKGSSGIIIAKRIRNGPFSCSIPINRV
jgi:hypothetical protein